MNISDKYREYCKTNTVSFTHEDHVRPYDDTTLFCPAGMQQYKSKFRDLDYKNKTVANIQPCIRLNDYEEMGDGTHLLYFNMIGLFSFRDWSLQDGVDFWMTFIQEILKLKVDYVTLHPDKIEEWNYLYKDYNVEIRPDDDCTWSDGESPTAFCTEFYINDIEIGNIVNPHGDCLDAGFGYERLDHLVNGTLLANKNLIMRETLNMIFNSGFRPGPNKQGSIIRRLIRDYNNMGEIGSMHHHYNILRDELDRQEKCQQRYHILKKAKKRQGKDAEWWKSTFGIDLDLFTEELD